MQFGEKKDPAYDHLDAEKSMKERNGTQAGDPPKAALKMYELGLEKEPTLRCVLGSDAYKAINDKIEKYRENVKKYEKISNATDVDE